MLLVRLLTDVELPILFHTSYVILPVAEQTGELTVTKQLPDLLLPSVDVAVMVVVPAEMPVTYPLLFTVATAVLLEVQLRELLETFEGNILARIVTFEPTFTVELEGKLTEDTRTERDDPIGDNTEPGITSDGTVPVCPGFNQPTARQSPP
jgi:hypothetical protein